MIELTSNLVTCYATLDSMLNHTATGFAILRKAEGPEVVSTFSETFIARSCIAFQIALVNRATAGLCDISKNKKILLTGKNKVKF